jgi:predicted nucleotidyltransferase
MDRNNSFSELAQALVNKTITKEELLTKVTQDFSLIPLLLDGVGYSKAAVRYGCAKVLMDLSSEYPENLYPLFDSFVELLDSKYRILMWNALAIIANLTRVDADKKFDAFFDKYYRFLDDDYMVTVANVVGNSGTIAHAKPYLISKITDELLKVQDLSVTPHLTEECKRVIAQQTIKTFDLFFDRIDQKERVLSFVESCRDSPREKLRTAAEDFLEKWGQLA